jgi:hypothetical protein
VTLTPEQELLVCCARLRLDSGRAQRLRELLAGRLDFDALLGTAHVHGVAPLLAQHLLAEGSDLLPSSVRGRLQRAFHEIAARHVRLIAELARVLPELRAAGVLAVPFKGPVIAVQAYERMPRQYWDLDILVRRADLDAAAGVLLDAGYRELGDLSASQIDVMRRTGYSLGFVHRASGVVIELHWRFGPTWFHFPLDLDALAGRLDRLALAGVDVPVLGPEDTLLVLCAHGAKHLWTRLEWICVVLELVQRGSVDWTELTSRASVLGARRFVGLGLRLAQDLLGLSLVDEGSRRLAAEPEVSPLARELMAHLFDSNHDSHRPWAIAVAGIRARERARDRLRHAVSLVFVPTIEDAATLGLPRRLTWLYHLTRPVRLTWRYGLRRPLRRRGRPSQK